MRTLTVSNTSSTPPSDQFRDEISSTRSVDKFTLDPHCIASKADISTNTANPPESARKMVTPAVVTNKKEEEEDEEEEEDDTKFYLLDPNQLEFDALVFCGPIESGRDRDPLSFDLSLNILAQEQLEYEFGSRVSKESMGQAREASGLQLLLEGCELEAGSIPVIDFDNTDLKLDDLNLKIRYLLAEKECYNTLVESLVLQLNELIGDASSHDFDIHTPILDQLSAEESEESEESE